MAKPSIAVERKLTKTIVRAEDWPDRSLTPFVCSCNASRAVSCDLSQWKPGDGMAITKRLGSGGAEKGRILWAVNYYMVPGRWEAMGALLLHVPQRRSKPILIERVCVRPDLNDRDKTKSTAVLVGCAKQVAEVSEKAGGRLHWEVNPRDARQICDQFGFSRRGNNRQMAVLEWKPT